VLKDVDLKSSMPLDELIGDAGGFKILDVRLEFLGLCPGCLETPADLHKPPIIG
jgi:Fe2+ or Zn2+ uptake regulation protein